MSREKKAQIIDSLQEVFSQCNIGILTDYRGLSASEMNVLRRRLRESGIGYKVVKNTLARFAAERAGKDELASFLEGPIAVALGYGDITEPAKVLTDYIRTSKASLSIKGGFLGDKILTLAEVDTLSTLPSREILLAKVLGGMQSPIVALVSCLTTPIQGIIGVLQARIQQLEGE
ncbi:MAG TPA: 50S ribosomal protein L10 [Dehalococcoidia bacterium]|jgi:large subunit ribosomal protein L10|nr:50S ribosomal protein L10 [Dehalococcoidia bacterium]